jgi:hypothetical protein
MKNIHLIPTGKPSRLIKNNHSQLLLTIQTLPLDRELGCFPQNIYITSDEEIKEGDWFYVKTTNIYGGNIVAKCLDFGSYCWSEYILTDTTDEKGYHPSHCVKIILTTDLELQKDGVQAIDDEFLEWFVNNPSCEEVEYVGDDCYYEIIIPQEEPTLKELYLKNNPERNIVIEERVNNFMKQLEPKQELEEAAERLYPTTIDSFTDSGYDESIMERLIFINGAKWQQEKIYEIMDLYADDVMGGCTLRAKEWFEQFKKK